MSDLVIVDTNIVSYIFNKNPVVIRYLHYLDDKRPGISVMTREESLFGAKRMKWGPLKMDELDALLDSFELFQSSDMIIESCSSVRALRKHRTIPVCDAWIAATALALECPLVTHNPKDFTDIPGLEVVTFYVPKPK